jgi:hypothetical protein
VPDRNEQILRLPANVRQRLEAFAQAIDDVPPIELAMFGTRPSDAEAHDRARADADEIAAWHGWREGLETARERSVAWLEQRLDASPHEGYWTGLRSDVALRPEDRLLIAQSLADAVRAIALWDLLDESDRDELLGPWAGLVEAD